MAATVDKMRGYFCTSSDFGDRVCVSCERISQCRRGVNVAAHMEASKPIYPVLTLQQAGGVSLPCYIPTISRRHELT